VNALVLGDRGRFYEQPSSNHPIFIPWPIWGSLPERSELLRVAEWELDWNLSDVREGYGAPRLERKIKDEDSRLKGASGISTVDGPVGRDTQITTTAFPFAVVSCRCQLEMRTAKDQRGFSGALRRVALCLAPPFPLLQI
jgi:hypothetical protein